MEFFKEEKELIIRALVAEDERMVRSSERDARRIDFLQKRIQSCQKERTRVNNLLKAFSR